MLEVEKVPVFGVNTGKYYGQSHKSCRWQKFVGPRNKHREKDKIDM